MKLPQRSTASLVLTVLALALGFAFSVWCVGLAISIEALRVQITQNMALLYGLEEVRSGLLNLKRVVLDRDDAEAKSIWENEYNRVHAGFRSITVDGEQPAGLPLCLKELDEALGNVDVAALALLEPGTDDPDLPDLAEAFYRADVQANERTAAAIGMVRISQREVSSTLERRWRSLFVLAVLSVAALIVLALLFRHARRDAERHRQAEESLRDSEQRLASVLAAVPDLIIVLDAKGEYRDVFTAKPDLLYSPTEQLLGRTIHDVLPKESAEPIQDVIRRTIDAGTLQSFEYPLTIADDTKWFSARAAPFGSPDDPCVLWVATDITARRQAVANLRESEARFRQLAENIDEVVSMAPVGRRGVEYVSPAYETIFGRSCQSLYQDPRSWQELIHPDDKQRVLEAFEAKAPLGQFDEEFRIVRDDGSIRWIRDRTFPIHDAQGGLYRVAGLSQDITERKNADQELRDREERFRSVLDTANDAVIVADDHSIITLWNKAAEEIFGFAAEEAVGQPLTLVVPERFHQVYFQGMAQPEGGLGSLLGQTTEQIGLRKDGTEFPLELSLASWQISEGMFFAGIIRDVTARKRAEAALRESEQRFRSAFDDTAVGMMLADASGRFTSVNQSCCEMLGYTEQELCSKTFRDITHPDDLAESTRNVRKMLDGEQASFSLEKRYLRKNGSVVWALTSVAAVRDAEGGPLSLVAETQDITERKRAEEALRESETLLRQLTENIREVFWMTSDDGQEMIYISPGYEEIWGRTCQSLYERPVGWAEAIHHKDRDRVMAAFFEGAAKNGFDEEYRVVRPDGSIRWIRDRGFPIRNDAGEVQRIAGIAEDISELVRHRDHLESLVKERTADLVTANENLRQENIERRRAEKIHRDRSRVLQLLAKGASLKQVLRLLLETIEELDPGMFGSILLLDDDKKRLRHGAAPSLPAFYNEAIDGLEIGPGVGSCATAAYTGGRVIVEDVMTHPYWAPFRELAQRAGLRACWSEPIISSTHEVLGTFAMYYGEPRGPDEVDLELIRSAASLAGIAIEHKRAEAEIEASHQRLRVADRLASLGTLTAGLGHDMNNVLFPIRCRLGAMDWKKVPPDLKDVLTSSRTTVNYLQQLCNGLRLLAVDPEDAEASAQATTLAPWWRQVEPLLTNLVSSKVTLLIEFPDDLPAVAVAPHRLTQSVMNLVVNASEAMPEGGRVLVWARAGEGKRIIHIGVTDEGVGMTEETRQCAFDPFFTTKRRSLSTGFGLSLVHSLVRMSRGTVTIESAPGRGTTVAMHLPAALGPAATLPSARWGTDQAAVTLSDRRTAAWIANMLESAGYSVRVAEDGDPSDAHLWVTEPTDESLRTARAYANDNGKRRIIVIGPADPEWLGLGAVVVEDAANRTAIHAAVFEVTPV
ncbi:MAG: PAS domain-containing protein [Planctomycetota bacterium]|jgi:PAS domain S-box-containing protein